jgi:hypothetical protein
VDHHIDIDAAAGSDIFDGGKCGVAGGDGDKLRLADFACRYCVVDGLVVVVETAHKAHQELNAGFFDSVQRGIDAIDIQVQRLFAKHVLFGGAGL